MDARTKTAPLAAGWRPDRCGRVALVLQGGGALGAYQAGVYQAMHEAGIEPDWVSGVSIGAINSAIIAGNAPDERLDKLKTFWERITSRTIWAYTPDGDVYRNARNATSSLFTLMMGQPGFFEPNPVSPWLTPAGARAATAYYNNGQLRETLLELVDFDRINSGAVRFSVGAVNVVSGNFIFFDNATTEIGPEHVMASGALPPALPAVQIGTDWFWDGGIVSNTPLQHLLAQDDDINSLVFQVDLFNAHGLMPRTMQDVMGRHKDIMYSSRTRQVTDMFQRLQRWKTRAYNALLKVPDADLTDEERAMRDKLATLPALTVLQLIYQQQAYEGNAKDYEFSGTSMREHWASGLLDTERTLTRKDWLQMPPPNAGILTHDIHRETEG
ncbi:patatin-like phospholipase family protein [Phenylobacterium sp.]|uniref:patatin-like phospholipase family protein n=1 Tax=Phenylobacterium sp. TaxID=1871053 RepID=UPI0025FFCCA8|nr:patatin-like phospholipase family protein [Phenylobacterium sp.]